MMTRIKVYPDEQISADELVERNATLVHRIAYHLSARLPASVLVDDLIQAGMIGLLDAAQLYDPTQGAAFETYATIRIRGAMLDELRRNDWAPKSVHRRARDLMQVMHEVENETGRDARAEEVAERMDISLDEYHKILHEANTCRLLNFADLERDDSPFNPDDKSSTPSPLQGIEKEEFRGQLADAIANLPERERLIVSLYYDDTLNLKEIGVVLGVSESRVSQLLSQAHLRMRAKLEELVVGEI
ncbi:MAG: RNA polymerase sigma factor FliA [Gammaproteobacteria bacterium]